MSQTTDIYITPSTSLVLIKNLSSVTNVYLRGYNVSPFSVTIRDTTGLSNITVNPVRISTIESARFVDGSSYYPLNQPYGLVNLTLRNSNVWQINHTSGQLPEDSAANVGSLSVNTAYVGFLSTAQKRISTFTAESLTTPNSISLTGPFIVSNLSTPGFVLLEEQLNVYGNVFLRSQLNVSGATFIVSSFSAKEVLPISGITTVYSSMGVGGFMNVGETLRIQSTLFLRSTVQIDTLQVQCSTTQASVHVDGNASVNSFVSTLGSVSVGNNTSVGGFFRSFQEVSASGGIVQATNLSVRENALFEEGALIDTTAFFGSSIQFFSSVYTKGNIFFQSTVGTLGPIYANTVSSFIFSTLGSLSTTRLQLIDKATINGNVSSVVFQSYEYISIGGELITPSTISSLGTTYVRGDTSVVSNAVFDSALVSSFGVGTFLSVQDSVSTGNALLGGRVIVGKNTTASHILDIFGNIVVTSTITVDGNLFVLGASEISSFRVESFLLSNLNITQAGPIPSFRASSMNASTLLVSSLRIFTPTILTVSTTFASTTQANVAETENSRFETMYTDSFFVGQYDIGSDPKFVVNENLQFLEGISTVNISSSLFQADRVEGTFIGNVNFLSNVPLPFANISAISLTVSTLNLDILYLSSFTASTFQNNLYLLVQSSIQAPHLSFESQGFAPRFDVNQFLVLDSNLMVVNRGLYFDRTINFIGIHLSTPLYDLDVSGSVFASNIYYSSINPIVIESRGFDFFSTVLVSSSYVRDSLQFGMEGLRIQSDSASSSNWLEINQKQTYQSNYFGILNLPLQSTILLNTGVFIYRDGKVSINGYNAVENELLLPTYDFEVVQTMRSDEVFTSTGLIRESAQSLSFVSPYLYICSNTPKIVNTMSACIGKISMNSLLTIEQTNQRVGLQTLDPVCSLDVRGNAYFSSVNIFDNFQTTYLATGLQEI